MSMPLRLLQVSENTTIGVIIGTVFIADLLTLWMLLAK
jgi:hypothetical protein